MSKTAIIVLTGIGIIGAAVIYCELQLNARNSKTAVSPTPTPISVSSSSFPTISSQAFAGLSLQRTPTGADIVLDTAGKSVSAIQLDIAYSPDVLTDMRLIPGNFFMNPVTLANEVDPAKGTIFYAAALPVNGRPWNGKGIVASLNFTTNRGIVSQTAIQFMPKTKVTALNISDSILKTMTNLTFTP